ncbi:hypothetical protein B566_EDAN011293 [Ephemera danica]|nr:hypothetical protein B566_EDAN011293 [Ephemera danica]
MMDEPTFAFIAEWYDEEAAMARIFRMIYFPTSTKIQLFEPKTQKMFLRKSAVDGLKSDDMFVGNTILILSRMFSIKDYADEFTRKALSSKTERTFAMIKPDAVKHMGEVIKTIQDRGLKIRAATMAVLTEMQASEFYQEHTGKPFLPTLIKYVTSGPVLAMQLQGEGVVRQWRTMIGPTDPVQALAEDPTSLRARFGTDKTYNGFHGSDSTSAALREISIFFPTDRAGKQFAPRSSATFKGCTCCLIKPHAIQEGKYLYFKNYAGVPKGQLGPILSAIQEEGFNISGLELVRFDRASAAEFHEIYDGVLYEYMVSLFHVLLEKFTDRSCLQDMVTQLQSGPSVVLEITAGEKLKQAQSNGDLDIVENFRQFVGPMDPELARKIRPKSLRARFGKTTILNALHCTDLADDGALEVIFF